MKECRRLCMHSPGPHFLGLRSPQPPLQKEDQGVGLNEMYCVPDSARAWAQSTKHSINGGCGQPEGAPGSWTGRACRKQGRLPRGGES